MTVYIESSRRADAIREYVDLLLSGDCNAYLLLVRVAAIDVTLREELVSVSILVRSAWELTYL